jgi:hypothetical protein
MIAFTHEILILMALMDTIFMSLTPSGFIKPNLM